MKDNGSGSYSYSYSYIQSRFFRSRWHVFFLELWNVSEVGGDEKKSRVFFLSTGVKNKEKKKNYGCSPFT